MLRQASDIAVPSRLLALPSRGGPLRAFRPGPGARAALRLIIPLGRPSLPLRFHAGQRFLPHPLTKGRFRSSPSRSLAFRLPRLPPLYSQNSHSERAKRKHRHPGTLPTSIRRRLYRRKFPVPRPHIFLLGIPTKPSSPLRLARRIPAIAYARRPPRGATRMPPATARGFSWPKGAREKAP